MTILLIDGVKVFESKSFIKVLQEARAADYGSRFVVQDECGHVYYDCVLEPEFVKG
jgi:hypothetical protein